MSKSHEFMSQDPAHRGGRLHKLGVQIHELGARLQAVVFRIKACPSSTDGRHIPLVSSDGLLDERRGRPYIDNKIKSSRHSLVDFLPRQLFAQFSKLANFYFLCVSILQLIPGLSTTGTYTTIVPLLFFVTLSIAKEGYDDLRRYRMDKLENRRLCRRLCSSACDPAAESSWDAAQWQNVRVGDLLKISRDDALPSDLVLLQVSNDECVAHFETMALDGETNLKIKHPPRFLAKSNYDVTKLLSRGCSIVAEDPNMDLYGFEGRVETESTTAPLTNSEIVYRGSILRNTAWAIGVVVYTGEECKIRMNTNQSARIKAPALQWTVNRVVMIIVAIVVILAIFNTVAYQIWRKSSERKAWYLSNAHVSFFPILTSFIILFNTMIPLSLYVSLEIVKLFQLLLMQDIHMYEEKTNTPMEAHTSTINEDLGQINYIFSDKTGTLTDNDMQFRGLSVAGTSWHHPSEASPEGVGDTSDMLRLAAQHADSPFSQKVQLFLLSIALCHTCVPEESSDGSLSYQAVSPDELALVQAAGALGFRVQARNHDRLSLRIGQKTEGYLVLHIIEFSSIRKRMSVVVRMPNGRVRLICKGADSIILKLLRQSDLAMAKVQGIEQRVHERRSRDIRKAIRQAEEGRIRASTSARTSLNLHRLSLGAFSRQTTDTRRSSLEALDRTILSRKRLNPLGFDEDSPPRYQAEESRKKYHMKTDHEISALPHPCTILDEARHLDLCFQHINAFASEGLRTLTYAHRDIDEQEYMEWKKRYEEASASLVNRGEKMAELGAQLETNLELTGATAIEDKLQEGVPEAVDMLRRANIKLWMLTGDKRETAINIARSCKLIKDFSSVSIIDTENGDLFQQMLTTSLEIVEGIVAHTVIVVDGNTLAGIYEHASLRQSFESLAIKVDSVICCRASPSQKSCLVHSIRSRMKKAVTLAIGDGANDIAMIQEAHVGIGITGKEGLQAARTADYAVAQFRFLPRLLLVHGRWNYDRTCKYTLGTFWKEMTFYLTQALFQHSVGYTGTSLYEPWSLSMFNTLFTSLPVIFLGIFEQDLPADILLAMPQLYSTLGPARRGFNVGLFFQWIAMAVVQAALIFFLTIKLYAYATFIVDDGIYAIGDLSFTACIIVIAFKLQFWETANKTYTCMVAAGLSICGWFLWNLILSSTYKHNAIYAVRGGFLTRFGRALLWWLALVIILCSCWILEILFKTLSATIRPTDVEEARIITKADAHKTESVMLGPLPLGGLHKRELTCEEQEQREREVEEILEHRDEAISLDSKPKTVNTQRQPKVSFTVDEHYR